MERESDEVNLYTFESLKEFATRRRHPLIQAAKDGNYDQLTLLIREQSERALPLTIRDQSGWQAIHFAAKLSDTKCLSSLLAADSSLAHSLTRKKISPLMVAARAGKLNAVNVLIPLLSHEELFGEDLHGLNALYYAVSTDLLNGITIFHSLLRRLNSGCVAPLICGSSVDSLPHRVVRTHRFEILKAMLDAGLDPAYRRAPEDESSSLVNVSISGRWAAGVELFMKAQLNKHGGSICSLWELFTSGKFPALAKIFDRGDLECWQLLADYGVEIPCHSMSSSGDQFDTCRFLSSVVSSNIWGKQDVLRFFVEEESCSQFQQHLEHDLLSVVNEQEYDEQFFWRYYQMTMEKMGGKHPLLAVVDAIEGCSDEHSVGDCVQLLLDSKFTFDFRLPEIDPCGIVWEVCIDHLMSKGYHSGNKTSAMVALELMKRQTRLPITMDTVVMACLQDLKLEESSDSNAIRPLALALKYLAARPTSELAETLRCSVVGSYFQHIAVFYRGMGVKETQFFNDEHFLPVIGGHWRFIALLLLKGIQAQLLSDDEFLHAPTMPFSVVFLGDNERKRYFEIEAGHCKDPFELELKMQMVSSLQSLCRTVIRNAIGVIRLFREPLPTIAYSAVFAHDVSWEVSSIDQLGNIPQVVKDYLRFTPDLEKYTAYIDRCTDRFDL